MISTIGVILMLHALPHGKTTTLHKRKKKKERLASPSYRGLGFWSMWESNSRTHQPTGVYIFRCTKPLFGGPPKFIPPWGTAWAPALDTLSRTFVTG